MNAFEQGQHAFWNGCSFFDNPFDDRFPDYHDWELGYIDAQSDYEE